MKCQDCGKEGAEILYPDIPMCDACIVKRVRDESKRQAQFADLQLIAVIPLGPTEGCDCPNCTAKRGLH